MTRSRPARGRRRRYDSPLRRRQTEATRERIVAAGAELLHGFPVWNWAALTIPRVAERAGVTARTVYRHFAGERELRDAVLARLEREAGVELEGLELGDLRAQAERILEYVSSFPLEPRTQNDQTFRTAHARQREALLAAVGPYTRDWRPGDRVLAAAVLDALWSVASYERMVAGWQLEPKQAIRGITWVFGLIEQAIRRGRGPGAP